MKLVRAAGFEPAFSAFRVRRGRPDSPTPLLRRGFVFSAVFTDAVFMMAKIGDAGGRRQ